MLKKQVKNLGPSFGPTLDHGPTLDQVLTKKQILDQVLTLQHICICIEISLLPPEKKQHFLPFVGETKKIWGEPKHAVFARFWVHCSGPFCYKFGLRKREGVQKSMGNKVPWKIGMLLHLPVTSQPRIFPQKEAFYLPVTSWHPFDSLHSQFLSPFNFATHEMEDPFATSQKQIFGGPKCRRM